MSSAGGGAQLVCAQEALDLLNCVTQTPYDQEKCIRLLQSLRECVLNKKVKKFTMAKQEQPAANPSGDKA
ncbi:hypothetical protein SAY87_024817 [Trapa incisa]|uniref:CHCH domain-containing protein n=1 Tax=Trapa incisa TaxID=236973 RepID=A0AAN7GGI5_9MYRT|nr:hypothetical protein SAY87_024817 [Trapa incisa]